MQQQIPTSHDVRVPSVLAGAAAWCWRILIVAAAFLALVMLLNRLFLVVVPFMAAILIAALLHPPVAFLRRHGVPRALATWITVLVAFAALGGLGLFVVDQVSGQYSQLVDQVSNATDRLRNFLVNGPLHLDAKQLDNYQQQLLDQLNKHRSTIASGAVSAGRAVVDLITGLILCFFITFFLMYDGDRIWTWLVRLFPRDAEEKAHGAGLRAWTTLSGYIHGTVLIALFHGVVIGTTLAILGVPLVVPLALLVFIGSFIPIIGAVLFGGFAVIVALLTKGVLSAVVLLIVLVVENQIEAHLLQPFVVGRYVRLHPLAIALSLTAGALLGGLVGAIVAVPVVAAVNAAVKFLSGREDIDGHSLVDEPTATKPEPTGAEPEPAEPEPAEPEQAEPEQAEPEAAEELTRSNEARMP